MRVRHVCLVAGEWVGRGGSVVWERWGAKVQMHAAGKGRHGGRPARAARQRAPSSIMPGGVPRGNPRVGAVLPARCSARRKRSGVSLGVVARRCGGGGGGGGGSGGSGGGRF